jgi:hypothetical protein
MQISNAWAGSDPLSDDVDWASFPAFPSECGGLLGKKLLGATEKHALNPKYRIWYYRLMGGAQLRVIPTCYTENHHILPKSLGGGDEPENMVRLTYREHFIAHWLLTKFHVGSDLRKMQRALLAMSMPKSGNRIVSSWQFEAARRAVRDLELDPEAEAAWYERWRISRASFVAFRKVGRPARERKSKRPGKRQREAWAAERAALGQV